MQRFIAILFLCIFLSANTAFGEVVKLRILILHYSEHTLEDDEVSFLDFLAEHYLGEIDHEYKEHKHAHEHLPFKTAHSYSHIISIVPDLSVSYTQNFSDSERLKIPAFNQQTYSSDYLENIWQPPAL